METVLIAAIVLLAVLYMGNRLYRAVRRRPGGACSCGCSGCASSQAPAAMHHTPEQASACSHCQPQSHR